MTETTRAAILGTGVIGASWAALFLARGWDVSAHDPAPDAEARMRAYLDAAWPTLEALGAVAERPGRATFHAAAAHAVDGAAFVQESVPEKLEIKHALYAEIEPALAAEAVVASSASGLTLSQMQAGWRDPSRFVLGHPFNPPHLIPLVEVMGPEQAAARAEAVYASLGKVTIRVRREVPGHVANRLQAALWREAIHLVAEGVASVEDVDKAVWAGPGLRWAAMGPTMLFHLGAGEGGLAAFLERYADSFHGWWDDLGEPRLDEGVTARLIEGVAKAAGGESTEGLAERRDLLLQRMLAATRDVAR
jgi:carnitine 3-dehydrogenase